MTERAKPAQVEYRSDGVAVVVNNSLRFLVYSPSRGREKRIGKNPLLPYLNVLVHESEREAYEAVFADSGRAPASIQTHRIAADPTKLSPLPAIRNVILDALHDEDFVFMVDDDFAGMMSLITFVSANAKVTDPQHILDIFCQTGMAALDAGTNTFCYAQTPVPYERRSYNPFRLRGWGMAACMGVTSHNRLRFDENVGMAEDIDFFLQSVREYRFIWQDMRWSGVFDEKGGRTGADPGGLAHVRSAETTRLTHLYLEKKWGKGIVRLNGGRNRGNGLSLTVLFN